MKQNNADKMAEILATLDELKEDNKALKAQIASNVSNGKTVFANLSKSGRSWICDLDEMRDMFGSGKLYIQETTRRSGEHTGDKILTIKKVAGSGPDMSE